MLLQAMTGTSVMFLCLLLQGSSIVGVCVRHYVRLRNNWRGSEPLWMDVLLLFAAMLLFLLGIFVQIAIWAEAFLILGEFPDFATALYHSSVNFVMLGRSSIALPKESHILGQIEAANGVLMFWAWTAVMTAAVVDVVKYGKSRA